MILQFSPDLDYQQAAIKAVVDLFEGQSAQVQSDFALLQESEGGGLIQTVGNHLVLSEEQILENVQKIQKENEIPIATKLDGLNFSIEMETGTGKTYVYLRTIYELNEKYGFCKFVIVVPSIAIREGVLKNLQITHEHFQNMYNRTPIVFQVYDSTKVSSLRGFAISNNIDVLVLNIDSFAKDENIINKPNDKLNGQKPIAFIQATKPILIIDEPQNMETEKRQKALEKLHALCTLRYSATHKNRYNLLYSLNPVKAYDLGLVKQIEVDSVQEENSFNAAFIEVGKITATSSKITAKITIDLNSKNGVIRKSITAKVGDDLFTLTKNREVYQNGFVIEELDAQNQSISFSNGLVLQTGETNGNMGDEVMKFQIRRTLEEHLKKSQKLAKMGVKVLSLFFIDKVANYRKYDESENPQKGKFALWFEELYTELLQKSPNKNAHTFSVEQVHNGYFSQDGKGKLKDTNGETKADDDTYNLIMKDKEKLLDIENPLQFIFSHSALREGWDNPNVFQICTLNETKSEMKKRQEIGRGLRLAVGPDGNRIYDKNINILTVIANESYHDFAKLLQKEIEDDCGVQFENRIKNKAERKTVRYRKGFELDPNFLEIWEKIRQKTSYRVEYSTKNLIEKTAQSFSQLPKIHSPQIRSTKVKIAMKQEEIGTLFVSEKGAEYFTHTWEIPDVLSYIQNKTELTRKTIFAIIQKSGRIHEILLNPQLFMDLLSETINKELQALMIEGIKYQKIGEQIFEMRLFESQELEAYFNEYAFSVKDKNKTIYEDFIPLDSQTENQFARDCENSEQIKFFFKLPAWFKIPTPIGEYNPDWAIVFADDAKIYFVAETKNTGTPKVDLAKLHKSEQQKIACAKVHFSEFKDMKYVVTSEVRNLCGHLNK